MCVSWAVVVEGAATAGVSSWPRRTLGNAGRVNSMRRLEVFYKNESRQTVLQEGGEGWNEIYIHQTWVGYLHATVNLIRLSPCYKTN